MLKRFYRGGYPDITDAPFQRRDLIKRNRYLVETIQTTRGCPFNCTFCTVHKFNGRKPRHRRIKNVVDEIKDIHAYSKLDNEGRLIFFLDDNFYGDPRYAKELCRELIDMRKTIDFAAWGTQISFNVHHDEEMLV